MLQVGKEKQILEIGLKFKKINGKPASMKSLADAVDGASAVMKALDGCIAAVKGYVKKVESSTS